MSEYDTASRKPDFERVVGEVKKEAWQPTVRDGERPEDVSLNRWIGEALGAASMCWVGGTRDLEFDSEQCKQIFESLNDHVRGLFATFVQEAERRRQIGERYLRAQLAPQEHYDEQTMAKVRAGLRTVLGSEQVITDCIAGMQNEGVLFRERIPQ